MTCLIKRQKKALVKSHKPNMMNMNVTSAIIKQFKNQISTCINRANMNDSNINVTSVIKNFEIKIHFPNNMPFYQQIHNSRTFDAHLVVQIYALFRQLFWTEMQNPPFFFAFRMYGLYVILSWWFLLSSYFKKKHYLVEYFRHRGLGKSV